MLAVIERCLPGLTRREWGALAELAARRAGLDAEDVDTLRTSLHDARRAKDRRPGRPGFRPGDPVRMRDEDGGVMTVDVYRGNVLPKEVEVIWATAEGVRHVQTIPADLLEFATQEHGTGHHDRSAPRSPRARPGRRISDGC